MVSARVARVTTKITRVHQPTNGAKSGSNAFTNNLPIGEVKQGSNQGKVCCTPGEKMTSGTGKLN
ncbi:hypothetical protein SLEP1_g52170 [Rubroshorea leprosula]|uniref:Uncharacterized protein n=1 Tax=Rubroshorea leprosula TaxID=152421 RepID=A0AAV5M964_9ROSI|nr:hypothetical protein SLEP1_g52170 [Rubroshorea leprosula]